jgi:signal transduction histidine kinase
METILLIYNDEYFAKTIQEFLGAQGYNVKIERDADLAEQSAEQQEPQVIVLDALLQKTNGFELCQAFKANPALKEIPIIMTSALYISDEDRQTGIHFGARTYPIVANRCLMKPFKPLELLKQISYVLGKEIEAPSIPHLLIVDDEPHIRDLLKMAFENHQYHVQEVCTGEACLQFLASATPDVILLDYKLPDISGIEVLQEIRKTGPDIAVILMTAYGDENIAIHAIEEHVDGYLRKPFSIATLFAVLEETLEWKRIQQERQRLIAQLRESNRELTQHYELLEQANRGLRMLDKLKSEFLATVGHELRTPLNSIIGFTEILLQGYSGELNTTQRRQLTMVLESGHRLLRVLNDVIEVSLLNASQLKLKCDQIPIATIIHEVIQEVRHHAEKKQLTILTDIEAGLPACYCSHEKLKLILFNLVDNAIKFSPSGTITIAAHLASDLAQYGLQGHYPQHEAATPADPLHKSCLMVSVKDQGIGIDRENFTILFNEFRQLDGSLTREYGGTGLGLAISKKLVELHGGKIWLESQVGVGTTFYFSLPLS